MPRQPICMGFLHYNHTGSASHTYCQWLVSKKKLEKLYVKSSVIPFHLIPFGRTKFVVLCCSDWLNLCILYGISEGGLVSFVAKIVLGCVHKNRKLRVGKQGLNRSGDKNVWKL